MSTGKWIQPGVPHAGWTCVSDEDLGEPAEICEMCEIQEIRFVHYMEHPDYPTILGCGRICAGHMEQDYAAPRLREQRMRAVAGRRKRWLARPWNTSIAGNQWLNAHGYNITIFPKDGAWSGKLEHRATGSLHWAKRRYPTPDTAKLAALDAIQWLQQHAYAPNGDL